MKSTGAGVRGVRWAAAAIAVAACALLAGQPLASAAPGDLDPSFGVGGLTETRQAILQGHHRETGTAMAIGPKDEIFVLGAVPRSCPSSDCPLDLEVTRYRRHGARDASFGSSGRAILTVQPSQFAREVGSIAVGRDGKVVVAATNGPNVTVFRLTRDGALDPTFGGGVATSNFGGRNALAGVAVQPNGAVVVAVTRETALEGFQAILARYTPSGALDTGFGDGGSRLIGFAPGNYPAGLALPGRNRIAVGLSDCCYATGRAVVARFGGGGALDTDFARRGRRAVGKLAPASVRAVMPARRGRLLVVGIYRGRLFAARFLSNGRSDRRFGRRGVAWPGIAHRRMWTGFAVDGAGRALLAGPGRSSRQFALTRLRTNGSLDRTFAGGRAVGFREMQRSVAVGLQSSGRIVVFGEAGACVRSCPPGRFLLMRYMGGKSAARCAGRRANVVGTRSKDTLRGTRRRDVIQAFGGVDKVFGLGGRDLICGGQGNDVLRGGKGRDRILGGPGETKRNR